MLRVRLETLRPGAIGAVLSVRTTSKTVEVPTDALAVWHPGHHALELAGELAALPGTFASAFAG